MIKYTRKLCINQAGKALALMVLAVNSCILSAQNTISVIEGTTINNTDPGTWNGVDIARNNPTTFTYQYNSVTSVNSQGYMLQAGDESPGVFNNHLQGEKILGNLFTWNGTDTTSITHGIFTGYNINALVQYNYLDKVPMAIIRKSNGMTNTDGGVAYNVILNPKVGVVVKGMNGVKIYNNTFYSTLTPAQTWRGLIDVYSNTDNGINAPSTGTHIFNNIFYTTHQVLNIYVYDDPSVTGFESDYNIFWCEQGSPLFKIHNQILNFQQWQALGYDKHSVVVNPNFASLTTLVPRARLDYGTSLGTQWESGLSASATWGTQALPDTAHQNGPWQVGAYVFRINIEITPPPTPSPSGTLLYPNPAHGYFNISQPDSSLVYSKFNLSDLGGQVLLTGILSPGLNRITIPPYIPGDLYLITLEKGDMSRKTLKIVVN